MTTYDDVDEGVASKGVPCKDNDSGRAAAPAIAPAGVEVELPPEGDNALDGRNPIGVPNVRFSLTDRYLRGIPNKISGAVLMNSDRTRRKFRTINYSNKYLLILEVIKLTRCTI
jgi:hypothetical protein